MPRAYYQDYLKLDRLLSSQETISPHRDEMLFIVVHQIYEIWFKQILYELKGVQGLLSSPSLSSEGLNRAIGLLERIEKIQGQLLGPLDVLETMTPMDFLEFRNLLVPASGLQSRQFRELEVRLGIPLSRMAMDRLDQRDQESLEDVLKEDSLHALVHRWLERMPFTKSAHFHFWESYVQAARAAFEQEESILRENRAGLDEKELRGEFQSLEKTKEVFDSLEGISFSQEAMSNALFIFLYRDRPALQAPFKFLTLLMNIDANLTNWRHRHHILVQRMIGLRIGTGGSSGHEYLKKTATRSQVFPDLFNLSSFLIPRSALPELPQSIQKDLCGLS